MTRPQMELLYHKGVDKRLASQLLVKFGAEMISGVDLQIALGRSPHVVFWHDEGERSILIYAGNREFAAIQRINITDDNTALYAIAMPRNCDLARMIASKFIGREGGYEIDLS